MDGLVDQKFNIRLVQTIQKYPVIYNTKLKDYKQKNWIIRSESAWKAIAKKLNCDPLPLKMKWKNFRTTLLKKLKQKQMGEYVPPYYLYEHMKFVIPFMRKTRDPVASSEKVKNEEREEEDEDEDKDEDKQYETDPEQSAHGNEVKVEAYEISVEPMYFEYNKDEIDYNEDEFLPNPEEKVGNDTVQLLKSAEGQTSRSNSFQNSSSGQVAATNGNAKIQFLYSILPDLNEMSNSQMRHFKRRVQQLVDKVLREN